MKITTKAFRIALTTAALCAAATPAFAKPKRVVVLAFDGGSPQLAEAGRAAVASILGETYELVPSTKWEDARATAAKHSHGPDQWLRASKASGVGALIEGQIQDEGRRKMLTITVREADNGKALDPVTVRLDTKNGLSPEATRQLQTGLEQVLYWIDVDQSETPAVYQPVPVVAVSTGTKHIGSSKSSSDDTGEETVGGKRHDDGDDDAADAPRKHVPRSRASDDRGDDRRSDDRRSDDRRSDDRRSDDRRSDDRRSDDRRSDDRDRGSDRDDNDHDAKPTTVATAAPAGGDVHDISVLFPADANEQAQLNPTVHHLSQPTPRFQIDAGMYYGTRSLTFNGDPDANIQQLEGSTTQGFQVSVAAYPWPTQKNDGVLSGLGFTATLRHSLSSSIDFDDTDEIDTYVINENSWEVGVHYRVPLNSLLTFDGGAFYGSQSIEFEDASEDFEIPDTKYSYIGAGAHLDLNITEHATVGFGARYFTVLDEGMLASTDWFGPTSASGLGLEATVQIPLPKNLYLRGEVAYQKISMTMSGGGAVADDESVTDATDSSITGRINLGIAF